MAAVAEAIMDSVRTRGRPLVTEHVRRGDILLERWASIMGRDPHGLGWPPVTILGRLIEQGANGAAQSGSGPRLDIPDDVAIIDKWVKKLPYRRQRVVVRWYTGRNRYNQSACARLERLSNRVFRDELRAAREFIGMAAI